MFPSNHQSGQTKHLNQPEVNEFEWHSSPRLLDVRYLSEEELLDKELNVKEKIYNKTFKSRNIIIHIKNNPKALTTDRSFSNGGIAKSVTGGVYKKGITKTFLSSDNIISSPPQPTIANVIKSDHNRPASASNVSSLYSLSNELNEMLPKFVKCQQETEIKRIATSNNSISEDYDDDDRLTSESDTTYTHINHERVYSYDITKVNENQDEDTVTTSCDSSNVSVSPLNTSTTTIIQPKGNNLMNASLIDHQQQSQSIASNSNTLVMNGFVNEKHLHKKAPTSVNTSVITCPVCGPESQTFSNKHCLFCCRKISNSSNNLATLSSISSQQNIIKQHNQHKKTKSKSTSSSPKLINQALKIKTDSNGYVNRILNRASFKKKHSNHKHAHHHHHHHTHSSQNDQQQKQQLIEHNNHHLLNSSKQNKEQQTTVTKLDGSLNRDQIDYIHLNAGGGESATSSLRTCSDACCFYAHCRCYPSFIANCNKCNLKSLDKHGKHHNTLINNSHYTTDGTSNESSLPYWSVKHLTEKRVSHKKDEDRERYLLMFVTAFAIIVFLSVSYFGVLLFLRLTRAPID